MPQELQQMLVKTGTKIPRYERRTSAIRVSKQMGEASYSQSISDEGEGVKELGGGGQLCARGVCNTGMCRQVGIPIRKVAN